MRRFSFALAVVLAVLAPRAARAQDSLQPWSPDSHDLHVTAWGELGFWTSHPPAIDETVLSMVYGASWRPMSELLVRAELPFFWANGNINVLGASIHDSAFDAGNPFVSAFYVYETPELRVLAGGGLNVPAAPAHNPIDTFGGGWASAVHGLTDAWLWDARQLAIVARGHVETVKPLADVVVLQADLAIAPLIPVSDSMANTQLDIQIGATVGFQLTRELSTGLRFWLVWVPTANGDVAQSSLTPYFRADFGRAFVDLSLTMNLDETFGFAFDEGKYWGLRLAGGARF